MQLHYIFCLFFFISTSLFLKSQTTEWAPPGAHWYFCQGTGLGSPNCGGYFYQEVAGDTVVAGQACRKLSVFQKDWQNKITVLDNRYTFARNDSVYFYQPDSNRFLLTYDFTAEVGDTLEFPVPTVTPWEPEDTSFRVRVDSIVWRPAGQDTLRFFYVSPLEWENWGFYAGWYAEKIGGRMMFTPFPTITIPEVDGFFRCYADATAFIRLSLVDCDFTATGWFGDNPEWTYGYWGWEYYGLEKMEVLADTTIQGLPCKKIGRKVIVFSALPPGYMTAYQNARYVYEAHDRVSVWNGSGFIPLYDFNLLPGDTLKFTPYDCPKGYVIDSIGLTEVDGVELRFQKAWMLPTTPFSPMTEILIIERIGQVYQRTPTMTGGYFFLDEAYACVTDLPWRTFRCYSDTEIDLYKFGTLPCGFSSGTSDPEPFALEVFPNPAGAQLTIRLDGPGVGRGFVLYNALGQAVLAGDLPDAMSHISTSGIPAGVYVLRVWAKGGTIVRKIVKN